MPIQFRCTNCRQKLAISRRKAGQVVKCPACAADQQVPTLDEAAATGALVEPPPPADAPEPTGQASGGDPFFDEVPPEVFDDLDERDEPADSPPLTYERPFVDPAATPTPAPAPPAAVEGEPASAARSPTEIVPGDVVPTEAAARGPVHPWDEDEDEEAGFRLPPRPIDEGGLDMTPMVDVTFLLLIFFMITASFSIQKSMQTEAPEPDEEGAAQMPSMEDLASDSVIVEIDENDVIYVDDTQVASIAEVADQLQAKIGSEHKREMIIEAHPLSKHGTVVQVTDAGIEVGMQRIRRVSRKDE